jgi:cytochrome c oxidase assembly protein subunit 15
MNLSYSRFFITLNWTTLVFIYLVVIAGSFVRITGAGMGCPDWPKCFGQYVPPTDEKVLPPDYKDIYASKRGKKIERFANFLEKIGFSEVAIKMRNDKTLLIEQDFNAKKTWTEYINRLFGVLAGFGVLFIFIAVLRKYRSKKLVLLATSNLIILVIQAWFGSIVVATNLVPWTITLHLFLALVIIVIQLLLVIEVSKTQRIPLLAASKIKSFVWIVLIITFIQLFLGTQVRESIDFLVKQGYSRQYWVNHLGVPFFIHRSFSWIVLIGMGYMFCLNKKSENLKIISTSFYILIVEILTGVLLAYADMPGLVQTAHLLFATVLFGVLFTAAIRFGKKDVLNV